MFSNAFALGKTVMSSTNLPEPLTDFIKSTIDFVICTQDLNGEQHCVCLMDQSWVISYSTLAVIPKHVFLRN